MTIDEAKHPRRVIVLGLYAWRMGMTDEEYKKGLAVMEAGCHAALEEVKGVALAEVRRVRKRESWLGWLWLFTGGLLGWITLLVALELGWIA